MTNKIYQFKLLSNITDNEDKNTIYDFKCDLKSIRFLYKLTGQTKFDNIE